MKTITKYSFFSLIILLSGIIQQVYGQDSTKIKKMLGDITFGVPSSPAFELLPNKPSEVTHLTSASHVAAHVTNFINGGKLQTGAAVDVRPFAYTVGSLKQYQSHAVKRIFWRSVLSVGTASESQSNSDVYIGAGLRIPIIDKGDLRANPHFTELIESYQLLIMGKQPQPDSGESSTHYKARIASMNDVDGMKKLRDSLIQSNWNALRLDVGIGASNRAASGFVKSDSLFRDRVGLWLAMGLPLSKYGQLTFSGSLLTCCYF
jgi:hypothetical protein